MNERMNERTKKKTRIFNTIIIMKEWLYYLLHIGSSIYSSSKYSTSWRDVWGVLDASFRQASVILVRFRSKIALLSKKQRVKSTRRLHIRHGAKAKQSLESSALLFSTRSLSVCGKTAMIVAAVPTTLTQKNNCFKTTIRFEPIITRWRHHFQRDTVYSREHYWIDTESIKKRLLTKDTHQRWDVFQ